jgi:hypothetical protein
MSDAIWFKNPQILFDKARLLEFWPSQNQTAYERVNATTRFVLYATLLVYASNDDPRVFILTAMSLLVMFVLYKGNVIEGLSEPRSDCQKPTKDNPMANYLLGDDPSYAQQAPWYPSMKEEVQNEWKAIHPFERKRDAERPFYTTAASSWPNDQAAFTNAAFGKPFAPMCRDDPASCNPDGPYARGPERVQLRGGNGR